MGVGSTATWRCDHSCPRWSTCVTDLTPAALAWQCLFEGQTGEMERRRYKAEFQVFFESGQIVSARLKLCADWPLIPGLHVTKWTVAVAAGSQPRVTLTLAGDTRSD